MRSFAIATLAGSALAFTAPASADCAPEAHLSTCFDADDFWPHAGPGYFNFVGGTTTTPPRTFGLDLFATYAARPIVLSTPSSDANGAEVVGVDHLVDTTLLFSFGITERLDAGVALPLAAYRSGYGVSALTGEATQPISHTAMRDARVGAALRLLGCSTPSKCDEPFGLAARMELSLPTGDESSFAGDRSLVLSPSVSGEFRSTPFVAGAELGARIRKTSDLAGSRIGPQLNFAVGLGVDVLDGGKLGLFVEATALPTLVAQHELSLDASTGERVTSGTRSLLMPAEWQAGVRSSDVFVDGVSLSLGAGGPIELTGESGITTPRYRATISVRYVPHPAERTAP